MTPLQKAKLQSLDPDNQSGTFQSVLLRDDIHTLNFENTLLFLLKVTLLEKQSLEAENKKYFKTLKKHNLITNELLMEQEK